MFALRMTVMVSETICVASRLPLLGLFLLLFYMVRQIYFKPFIYISGLESRINGRGDLFSYCGKKYYKYKNDLGNAHPAVGIRCPDHATPSIRKSWH
jgi:hypothetical protein